MIVKLTPCFDKQLHKSPPGKITLVAKMLQLSLIICILCVTVHSGEDYDDYVYEDTPNEEIVDTGGERLINARAINPNNHQFVGAFFISSKRESSNPDCTASLISPYYALR